jgi:hypothetical protein
VAWPGALVAAALSQGYLMIFPLYLRYVLYPSHFGAIAGFALVALVFFYAYGLFIVIGAEIAALCAGYQPNTLDLTGILARSAKAPWPSRRAHLPRMVHVHAAPLAEPAAPVAPAAPAPLAVVAAAVPIEDGGADDFPTDPWLSAAQQ